MSSFMKHSSGTPGNHMKWSRTASGTLQPLHRPGGCLDVYSGSWVSGNGLWMWECNESPAQKFTLAEVVVCGALPSAPAQGVWDSCGPATAGATCPGSCNAGYVGNPFITCRSDGTWSAVNGSCASESIDLVCSGNQGMQPHAIGS